MNIDEIRQVLLWSVAINYAVLFLWFGVFVFAHDWLYRAHSRWFRMSVESFDALNYGAVAVYKIGVLLLNVVPWIALTLVSTQ